MTGIVFLAVFILSPHRGLIHTLRKRRNQKIEFAKATLLFHLSNHEDSEEESAEAGINTIQMHLHWRNDFTAKIIKSLEHEGHIKLFNGVVKLTNEGRAASIRYYNA